MKHKRTWIYCRVAYPGTPALAMQQMRLKEYAKTHGFEIVGITAEEAHGLDFSRSGLVEIVREAAAGRMDILLVANLSRLGRDWENTDAYLRWLEDHSVEVVCADYAIPQLAMEIVREVMKASWCK